MKAGRTRVEAFFFPPTSDTWLSVLRVGLGVQVVAYCWSLYGEWWNIFPAQAPGWINRDLAEAILTANSAFIPRMGWLVSIGEHLGLSEAVTLTVSWCLLQCAGLFLIIGLFCRTAAITAWLIYLCAAKSGNLFAYGVDHFTVAGLFYLVVAPSPDRYTLDQRIWRAPPKDPHLHGFFRRVLQLHLCVIYLSGGVSKALGSGWWNGESMWRSLTRPPFNVIPTHIILSGHAILPLIGIAVLVVEIGYPIFIWPRKTRLIWLVAILCMHTGIGLTMGLYLFALIMITLNLAAFGPEFIFRDRPSRDPVPVPVN